MCIRDRGNFRIRKSDVIPSTFLNVCTTIKGFFLFLWNFIYAIHGTRISLIGWIEIIEVKKFIWYETLWRPIMIVSYVMNFKVYCYDGTQLLYPQKYQGTLQNPMNMKNYFFGIITKRQYRIWKHSFTWNICAFSIQIFAE